MRNDELGEGKKRAVTNHFFSDHFFSHNFFSHNFVPVHVVFLCFFFICVTASAQDRGQFLIPQTVYVGDRAVLTIPLQSAAAAADIALDPLSSDFPSSADMDIHRIVLESRSATSRLIIEFTAFAPGLLEFPLIEIGSLRFS